MSVVPCRTHAAWAHACQAAGVQPARAMGTSNGVSGKAVKLWIDCDAGVDDAQAICLALAAPDVDIIGISTVHGNVVRMPAGRRMHAPAPAQVPSACRACSDALSWPHYELLCCARRRWPRW